jgi:hypothetical protein
MWREGNKSELLKECIGESWKVSRGMRRQKLKWICVVTAAAELKIFNIEYVRMYVQDRDRWRGIVHSKHMGCFLDSGYFESQPVT